MGYPRGCSICVEHGLNNGLINKALKLSVRPFQGKNSRVMLVGLNPTLTKRLAQVVFELGDNNSPIHRFISQDILLPAGLNMDDIYATNLVKCTFSEEPRIISEKVYNRKDNKAVKKILSPFFQNCRRYFAEEIREMNPVLIISFGEVPHQLIIQEFDLIKQNVNENMKIAFGNIYPVHIHDQKISYVPCIRLVAKNHPHFRKSWNGFIKELRNVVQQFAQ